ncbi:hypothetical protein FB451DRAFT_1430813 [Mycena latifolia]|nr:hypothetical protein FB451DRAFT_1430813 [Mycena latifolia]
MLLKLSLGVPWLSLVHVFSDRPPHVIFNAKRTSPIVSVEPTSPVTSRNGTILPPYNATYYFQQLIDHNNPSLETFTQCYWHTYEMYEPGGPIILLTPGEANAMLYVGYLTNTTISSCIAQQEHGATVVLEHRFFGLRCGTALTREG